MADKFLDEMKRLRKSLATPKKFGRLMKAARETQSVKGFRRARLDSLAIGTRVLASKNGPVCIVTDPHHARIKEEKRGIVTSLPSDSTVYVIGQAKQ